MSERLVCGIHAACHVLQRRRASVRRVYVQQDMGRERQGRLAPALAGFTDIVYGSAEWLTGLAGNDRHQGIVVAVAGMGPLHEGDARALVDTLDRPLILVLDGIQDPRNFGACLRTAEAAGCDLVVVPRHRNVALTPTVSKVAAGGAESQPLVEVSNLVRFLRVLKDRGIWITGADERAGQDLYDADLTQGTALVLGAEGEGLRRLTRETCDHLVHLPMHGAVESLNVAVAAGICLYEAVRQRMALLPAGTVVR